MSLSHEDAKCKHKPKCQLSVRMTIRRIILFTFKISCDWSITYRTLKIACDWSISYRTVAESLGLFIRSTVGNCLLIRYRNSVKE